VLSDDDDEEASPPVILLPRSKKRPNKPIKPSRAKALKKVKTSRTLVAIDNEDTDDGDDNKVTSPASPRTLPVRAARNQPAQTETTIDDSAINFYAPARTAAVKSLLVAPPAPLLPSAPSCQRTSLISASSTSVEHDIPNLFSHPMQMFERLQQHDVQSNKFSEAPSSSETMIMLSGLLYDNLAMKLKAEELERRERLRQESDNKSQFQAMFLAFANSLQR
jgi:hypothetical protein